MKQGLRAKLLKERQNYKYVNRDSLKIKENFFSIPEIERKNTFLLYFPHKNEVDTVPIIEELLKEGKNVILPKVEGFHIIPIKISNLTSLKEGYAGIKEPAGNPFPLNQIDVIVIPAVAFDKRGHRLGYGKGYYDRLLSKTDALKVGLAYDFQVLEQIPAEVHDIPVDLIVTPKGIIYTSQEQNKKEEQ